MKAAALLCVLALVASVSCSNEAIEFGVSIPQGFFGGFFNRLIFPLLDDWSVLFGRNFPTDCCYKGRGLKVQVTNLTESGLHADSVISSSSDGISMMADMGVNWDFHFKLCTEVGKSCAPLFSCNDDVELQFTLKLAALLKASADSNGKLLLSTPDASLELDVSYGKLCLTVKEIIAGVVDTVNKDLGILFPKLTNALAGAIGDALTLTLNVGDAKVQVFYSDADTGTSSTGLAVGGWVPVTNSLTGKQANFTPSSPLPNLLTTTQPTNQEEFFISDSIPNNILATLFEGSLPNEFKLDIYLQGNLFKLHFHLRESPQVLFSREGSSILVKTREVVQDGLLRIDFNVDTQIFFGFGHDENKIYLSLNPDNFVFDVEFLPPVDPLQNTSALIDQIVEAQWNKYIPILDEVLANYAIPLPPIPFFSFPGMEDFDGYTKVFVENKPLESSPPDAFAKLATAYPKTGAMIKGMAHGMTGPTKKFLELFGQRLAEVLEEAQIEGANQGRSFPTENGKKIFYCPDIIPGFSQDTCPGQ